MGDVALRLDRDIPAAEAVLGLGQIAQRIGGDRVVEVSQRRRLASGRVDRTQRIEQLHIAASRDLDVSRASADCLKEARHDITGVVDHRSGGQRPHANPELQRTGATTQLVDRSHLQNIRGAHVCSGHQPVGPRFDSTGQQCCHPERGVALSIESHEAVT